MKDRLAPGAAGPSSLCRTPGWEAAQASVVWRVRRPTVARAWRVNRSSRAERLQPGSGGDTRALAYCASYTFGSSLGQTFLIALFIPSIAIASGLGPAKIGALYSVATLLGAPALPAIGRLVDRVDLGRYGLAVGAMTAAGSILLALTSAPLVILAAMALVRLFGQGAMAHTGFTAAARSFPGRRGRALAIVGLGHTIGEALLPAVAMALIAALGWRSALVVIALVLGLALPAMATRLIADDGTFRAPPAAPHVRDAGRAPNALLRCRAFWALLPALVTPPFALTALLFHQGLIAAEKGMSLAVFAGGFIVYAVIQVPVHFLVGFAIDRIGAVWPVVLHTAPLAVGAAVLAATGGPAVVWVYLALAGATAAASGVLRTAIAAELVTPDQLGSARSLLVSLLVVSSAAGPVLYGSLLGLGVSMDALLWGTAVGACAAVIPALLLIVARRRIGEAGSQP